MPMEHLSGLPPLMPYLLEAFYDWMMDCDFTPHVVVKADNDDIKVPKQYTQNQQIVLNLAKDATRNLHWSKDVLEFDACFGGIVEHLYIPLYSITGIYAKENGAGTVFPDEEREQQKILYLAKQLAASPALKVVTSKKKKSKTSGSSTKKPTRKKSSTTKLQVIDGGNTKKRKD